MKFSVNNFVLVLKNSVNKFGSVSLFNGIFKILAYLMQNSSLQKSCNGII